MRILLLGGFGYLGSRLATALAARGAEVLLAGRRTADRRPSWASRFAAARIDVARPATIASALEGVEVVVQLAAPDVAAISDDPELGLRVVALGTRNVLAACERSGVRRVIVASSCNVYGPTPPELVDESTRAWPVDGYATAKLAAEGFCWEVNRRLGGPFSVVLRLANTYGAALDGVARKSPVHNDLCRQAAETGRIVLATPGLACRDFVWVDDVAQAIDLVSRADRSALAEPLYNVAGGNSMTIKELADRVAGIASVGLRKPALVERPSPPPGAAPHRFRVSTARLSALGYRASDRVDEETERLIDSLRA